MSILVSDPLILGLLAFLAGLLVARALAFLHAKTTEKESRENDRLLRSLEADLRVANKASANADEELRGANEELESANATVADLQTDLDQRTKQVKETNTLLKRECLKTNGLREDLSGRAEETIRAEAHARQIEVELSVVKAGTTAVHEEVDRLAAERQELTGRLHRLEDEMLRERSAQDRRQEEKLELDESLLDY